MTENNDLVENVFLLSYAYEPRDKKILTQTTHMAFDILADEGTIYNLDLVLSPACKSSEI